MFPAMAVRQGYQVGTTTPCPRRERIFFDAQLLPGDQTVDHRTAESETTPRDMDCNHLILLYFWLLKDRLAPATSRSIRHLV